MRLRNRVALITGAGHGIGAATARAFAREGALVAVADRDDAAAAALAAELGAAALPLPLDVADRASVDATVAAILARWGRIDVLVNNAGITRDARLVNLPQADWDAVLAVNLTGVFRCAQAVAPSMIANGAGCIISAASVVGLYGNFGQTNYVAAKAGVIGMTKTWARELGPHGIRANAVAPGFIATDMTATIPDKVRAALLERVPLRRMGSAQDVAGVYVFLASDEAAYINGAVISVDGGLVG